MDFHCAIPSSSYDSTALSTACATSSSRKADGGTEAEEKEEEEEGGEWGPSNPLGGKELSRFCEGNVGKANDNKQQRIKRPTAPLREHGLWGGTRRG
jgi:hypothetical protein